MGTNMNKIMIMCIYIYESVIMKTTVNDGYTLVIKAFQRWRTSAL